MDYFVLCAKSKNPKQALTETASAPLLFYRQSSETSTEMCIFSIHCKRSGRIVSLMNRHSKMNFWGKRSESSPWKKTICTQFVLCSWALLTGCLCFYPPPPCRLKICQDVSDIFFPFFIRNLFPFLFKTYKQLMGAFILHFRHWFNYCYNSKDHIWFHLWSYHPQKIKPLTSYYSEARKFVNGILGEKDVQQVWPWTPWRKN